MSRLNLLNKLLVIHQTTINKTIIKMIKRIITVVSVFIILISCTENNFNKDNKTKIIGVKIYEHKDNFENLFNKWKEVGINTVVASVELLSNSEFKNLAKQNNINTFVILPIFYAPEELEKDSTLYAITQHGKKAEQEWVKFVCPSEQEYIKDKIKFITNFVKEHNPTGISLDFIRHFTFWEKIYPNANINSLTNTCFDEKCITGFCKANNISYPNEYKTEIEIFNWIKKNHFDKWVKWKSNLITETVKNIVEEVKKTNPNIKVNLHAVPWRQKDFGGAMNNVIGQDLKSLAKYVDYLSPMTYSHMVKQKPEWIHSVVKDMKEASGAKILPSIQVGIAYLADTLSVSEFEQCLNEALKEPSSGVVFWNWDALALDDDKYNLIKKIN